MRTRFGKLLMPIASAKGGTYGKNPFLPKFNVGPELWAKNTSKNGTFSAPSPLFGSQNFFYGLFLKTVSCLQIYKVGPIE